MRRYTGTGAGAFPCMFSSTLDTSQPDPSPPRVFLALTLAHPLLGNGSMSSATETQLGRNVEVTGARARHAA
ncbi:unnamed protein product [Diplocarpon coronariae]